MKNKKRKLLFINAHPDDDSTVAGTMLTLVSAGWEVMEYVCTDGARANTVAGESSFAMTKNRLDEITLFSKLVGAKSPRVFPLGERMLKVDDEIVFDLVQTIRSFRPDVVVLLGNDDYHFEHRVSHQVGLLALENAFRKTLPKLGERITDAVILEADGLNLMHNPLINFDISKVFGKKMSVLEKAYGKRLGADLQRFESAIAQVRGGRVGVEHAEVFNLINPQWYRLTKESSQILTEFVSLGTAK
jgi:LmbE family N-acetylglucosaminyl deacetylase